MQRINSCNSTYYLSTKLTAKFAVAYKIAIVEDDRAVQLMYKLKLEHAGYEIAVASNGLEGLKLAETFMPDNTSRPAHANHGWHRDASEITGNGMG